MLSRFQLTLLYATCHQLLLGSVLWYVWFHNKEQRFTFYLGNVIGVNGFLGVFYILYRKDALLLQLVGTFGLTAVFTIYVVNLFLALTALANKEMTQNEKKVYRGIIVALVITALWAGFAGKPELGQIELTIWGVALGAIATKWLWRIDFLHRLIGPLFIIGPLLGLLYVFFGESVLQLQTYIGMLFRSIVALLFIFIAYDRVLEKQKVQEKEREELLRELQQVNTEMLQAYDETLQGWSRALDMRDKGTEGHTQRVVFQ